MSASRYLGICLLTFSHAFSDYGRCGSINGIELPCWTDFKEPDEGDESLPFYPYAKRENGCSIPGSPPGTYDNFPYVAYNFSFREACNTHDRCYYTLGTTGTQCNSAYHVDLRAVCLAGLFQAPQWPDLLGTTLRRTAVEACMEKASGMANAVTATQMEHHTNAQTTQRRYMERVQQYLQEKYGGVFPKANNRLWTGHGIADRWDFAKLFDKNRDVYVTHRNNGYFYATQYNEDGTPQNWTWPGGYGIANRWAFADVFGLGTDQYVTHRDDGTFYVTRLNRDNTLNNWLFSGQTLGHKAAPRWAFADVFATGRKQYVGHTATGTFLVTQLNEDRTVKNWTIPNGHKVGDRWAFARVFGNSAEIYVTHWNTGVFQTTRLNRDGTLTNQSMKGMGIADRWAFADIFGNGRDLYVTHRNDGTFYATQLNEDGSVKNWTWTGGYGIADRWAFTDFFGNGRKVYVTHRNTGIFYVTQLNEDGTVSNITLPGGVGIADRWKFANIFGKKSTVYATHRNNGSLHSTEIYNGVLLQESNLAGGTLTFRIDVPSNGNDLKVWMNSGTGDADLYLKKGAPPTLDSYDCRPYSSGNAEECVTPGPVGGTYYIMINPYSSFTGVSLNARFQP